MISVIVKLIKAGQRGGRLARYIASKSSQMIGNLGFGPTQVTADLVPWAGRMLCVDHGHSKASEVRHIVFSAPPGTPSAQARPVLQAVAMDWLKEYAPDRRWALGFQRHNGIEHAHLGVQNVGEDGEPLFFARTRSSLWPR